MNSLFLTATEGASSLNTWLSALTKLNLSTILAAVVIFLVGYMLIKWAAKLLDKLLERNEKLGKKIYITGKGRCNVTNDCTAQEVLQNTPRNGRFLFSAMTAFPPEKTKEFLLILTCADKLGLPTDSIITLLGTFGLAFSLAMQNSLSNLAGGLFILGSKPFETGDYVSVPGAEGTVSKVGFIHTTLTTVDNKQIHVPNSTITGSIVTNYSQCETRRVDLTIPVSYDCSLEQAKKVIEGVIAKDSRVLDKPDVPFVRVWELGASSVDIMVRVWCKASDYWELRSWLLENIKTTLDKEGIVIPYSQLDVHLIDKK